MSEKPEITHDTKDSRGYVPETKLLGTRWRHRGNNHIYRWVRFAWNGEDDTWMIVHERPGSSFDYLRSPANFYGLMSNGEPRYERIS